MPPSRAASICSWASSECPGPSAGLSARAAALSEEGIVTTVDAVHGAGQLDDHEEAVKQAAVADRIVLTKSDLAKDDSLADDCSTYALWALGDLGEAGVPALAARLGDAGYGELAGEEYDQWYPIWRHIEGRPTNWREGPGERQG